MEDIITQGKARSSVWGVAFVAVALFVAIVLIAGMFGAADVTAVAVK